MVNKIINSFALVVMLFVGSVGYAQTLPKQQNPPKLVNDFANIFSSRQSAQLEKKLSAFSDTTSTQIAVVTVNSLEGLSASEFATTLAHEWGIGVKGKDNGVLLLVKPKTLLSKGEVFIAVGYGLEGAIPDVLASRIVREVLIPSFQKSDIYGGVNDATTLLMGLSSGEYSADKLMRGDESGALHIIIFFVIFIVISILSDRARRRANRSQTYSGNQTTTDIPPILLFGPFLGHRSSSRSSGFGGGGFGGFGGFGGGGFGGGGAGGSW